MSAFFFFLHTNDNIRSHYLTLQQVRFDPSKGTCQLIPFFSFDETLDNSVNANLELLESLSDDFKQRRLALSFHCEYLDWIISDKPDTSFPYRLNRRINIMVWTRGRKWIRSQKQDPFLMSFSCVSCVLIN